MSHKAPPILYKYYSPDRLHVLDDLKVRFTNPSEFNDVFEMLFHKNDAISKKEWWAFQRKLRVFCLTEKPDNHLMWVHYAAQHRGFVIGFHSSSRFLSPEGGLFGEVKYERAPEDICPPVLECALYKEEAWRYEKEWRCIRSDNELDGSKYIDFRPGDIAEVIVGSQMEDHHVMKILGKLEGVSQHTAVKVCRIFVDREVRGLSVSVIDKKICPCCFGRGIVASTRYSELSELAAYSDRSVLESEGELS